jgi:hypothetical protein
VVSAAEPYGRNLDFTDRVMLEKKVNLNIWMWLCEAEHSPPTNAEVKFKVTLRLTVGQYVLVSSPNLGLLTGDLFFKVTL